MPGRRLEFRSRRTQHHAGTPVGVRSHTGFQIDPDTWSGTMFQFCFCPSADCHSQLIEDRREELEQGGRAEAQKDRRSFSGWHLPREGSWCN
jgi:hypothetical protein